MGAAHSLALNHVSVPYSDPALVQRQAVSSVDLEAIIVPTHSPDPVYTTTRQVSAPSVTAPPHFLFTWGDSYTSNGFDIDRERPSQNDPEGLPDGIGMTTTGEGEPNWIEIVTSDGPLNTLNYDFARGGASVDNRLTEGANSQVPDFLEQSAMFFRSLAMDPRPDWAPWNSHNSEFIVWFGRNDVYWQVLQNASVSPRLDNVIESYFHIMDAFYVVGGRRFLILGLPPMWREPIWEMLLPEFAPYVQPAAEYWTKAFTNALGEWRGKHPEANVTYIDPQPIFLRYLDNPEAVGAPNDICTNEKNTLPGNGSNCLWADPVHPAEGMSAALGARVAEILSAQNFYAGSPAYSADAEGASSEHSASADQEWSPSRPPSSGFGLFSFMASFVSGIFASPKGAAWW